MMFLDIIKVLEIGKKIICFFSGSKDLLLVYRRGAIDWTKTFWLRLIPISIVAFIGYFCYINYLNRDKKPIHYIFTTKDSNIYPQIDSLLRQCGQGSYIFWLSINIQKIDDERQIKAKLRFKDARGCVNDEMDCIDRNLKKLNIQYGKEFDIDFNTIDLMEQTKEGSVFVNYDIEDLRQYRLLHTLVTPKDALTGKEIGTIFPVKAIGITLVRDPKNNDIIYAFALSFIENAAWKCRDPWNSLRELGFKAKENL